jgi:hypothetical protein
MVLVQFNDTDTLRKDIGVASGGNAHIFGLKSDSNGNLLIVGEVVRNSKTLLSSRVHAKAYNIDH